MYESPSALVIVHEDGFSLYIMMKLYEYHIRTHYKNNYYQTIFSKGQGNVKVMNNNSGKYIQKKSF